MHRRDDRKTQGRRILGAGAALVALLLATGAAGAQEAPLMDRDLGKIEADQLVTQQGKVQIVVDAQDSLSDAEVKALGRRAGVELRLNSDYSDEANLYVGWVPRERVAQVLDLIESTEGVEYAEPNTMVQAFAAPNDPLYQYQWHFQQIDVEGAWRQGRGKDVVVAVIDTGVAYKSDKERDFIMAPDLKGTAFVEGYDFVDDDKYAFDEHGHGTHVAGTIAQTTNNKYGVAGIAYEAKIMPLRVLNKNGYGSVSDIADSIRFAADNDAKVINMSLGGPLPSLAMRSAIQYAHSKGVTIVAAAGNSGRKMRSWPAAYDHVIAVAATQFDRKTTFYSQWGSFVDIAAPGGNTREDQNRDGRPDGVMQQTLKRGSTSEHDFALYMGTSMASPHVAGAAAILVGQGVNNPDAVERILKQTARTDMKDKVDNFKERYGAGLLDANAASRKATFCQGFTRISLTSLLGLFFLVLVRRRDSLGKTSLDRTDALPFGLGALLASSGLFFLPSLLGAVDLGSLSIAVDLLSRPLAMLDLTLLGPSFHQTPVMASALVPLGALALGLGHRKTAALAAGLAVGYAGFLLAESWTLGADVIWLPGTGLLDRAWLLGNGLLSAALGYLSLKRY